MPTSSATVSGSSQLDLQFFKTEPDYFLQRRYADFGAALAKCVDALRAALKRLGWQAKTSLSDAETAAVAIAYNTGRYDPARGLKQGYFDGTKYYGESYFAYLQLAKSVQAPPATASAAAPRALRGAPLAAPAKGARAAAKRARKTRPGNRVAGTAAGAVPAKARARKRAATAAAKPR
jgi:hypothetical protein